MSKLCARNVFLALLALMICTGTVYGQTTLSIASNGTPSTHVQLVYVPGLGTSGLSVTANVTTSASSPVTFTSGNLPAWLANATVNGDTSTTANLTVSTTVSAITTASITTTQHSTFTLTPSDSSGDLTVNVDLIVLTTPLSSDATSYPLAFTHSTAPSSVATISVPTPVGSTTFTLDPAQPLPAWLTATVSGAATPTTPATVTFNTVLAVLNSLAPANYPVPVGLKVSGCSGCATLSFQVNLSVSSTGTSTLTVTGSAAGATVNVNWLAGSSNLLPVTVASSPLPEGFTATCSTAHTNSSSYSGSACQLSLGGTTGSSISGMAQSWGTPFTVSFDANYLDIASHGAQYDDTVTVTITVVPASGSTKTLTYVVTLVPPTAVISAVTPTSTASVATTSSIIVTLTGTGFACSTNCIKAPGAPTRVFVGTSATALTLEPAGLTKNVLSPTTMVLTISGSLLPTAGATAKLFIGVANQTTASNPSAPSGTSTSVTSINVTTNPVISAVTNSASYLQPVPGSNPKVSPYELISIFGSNFIPANTPGGIVVATPDPTKDSFATSMVVSGSGSTAQVVKVAFTAVGSSTATLAPVLFATPNQINAIVPSTIANGTNYKVTVSYGGSTATPSDPMIVSGVTADPGVFSLDSSGAGQGAIVNNTTTPALNGSSAAVDHGTIISIYMTGLGAPNSTATTATSTYATSCISPAAYVTAAALGTGATIDGAIVQSSKLGTGHLPPCLTNGAGTASLVTVKFNCASGGGSATVDTTSSAAGTYAGFVADSVAGLYQVNVAVPSGLSATNSCPLTVTTGTSGVFSSQSGVTVAVSGN